MWIIWTDGITVMARNTMTDQYYAGTDALIVFRDVISTLVGGERIYVKSGLYNVNGTIEIIKSCTLDLEDFAQIVLMNNSNCNMIYAHGAPGSPITFVIRGGILDGNRNNQVGGFYSILTENTTYFRVMESTFNNFGEAAIMALANNTRPRIVRSRFSNCYYASSYVPVYHCILDDCFIGVFNASLFDSELTNISHTGAYPGYGDRIIGNRFTAKPGATMSGVSVEYGDPQMIKIVGNEFNLSGAAASIGIGVSPNTNGLTVRGVVMNGNTIYGCAGSAISIQHLPGVAPVAIDQITIDDNIFANNSRYGVEIDFPVGGIVPNLIRIGSGNKFLSNTLGRIYPRGHGIEIGEAPSYEHVVYLPGSSNIFAGSVTGTGVVTGGDRLFMATLAGAGSTATGFNRPLMRGEDLSMDYDKEFIIEWRAYRLSLGSTTNAIAYLKIDDDIPWPPAPVDPSSNSVGFRINNFAVRGLVYGNGILTNIDLGVTLTDRIPASFKIHSVPGRGVFFYINDLLVGTVTTNLPSGILVGGEYITAAITNGASAADARLYVQRVIYRRQL
jgi:hypothetical protein